MSTVKDEKIYSTMDYGIFKRLVGNRAVTNNRIGIIKDCIAQVGYISNPIICNEKMEIIDGQGRVEALRQLNMPVEYRVIDGLGITECRAMNLKPTGWTLKDFVDSYAEQGNENYIRLKELHQEYGFSYFVINGIAVRQVVYITNGYDIRDGSYKLTKQRAEEVEEILKYLSEFKEVQKKIGGRKDCFFGCIGWVAQQEGVNLERLKNSVHNCVGKISPAAMIEVTLRDISEAYNNGFTKKNKRWFDYEWKTRENEVEE